MLFCRVLKNNVIVMMNALLLKFLNKKPEPYKNGSGYLFIYTLVHMSKGWYNSDISNNYVGGVCMSKSKAKAAGLKSSFAVGNQVLLTSFGKGNHAVRESLITGGKVQQLSDTPKFEVSVPNTDSIPESFPLKSKRIRKLQASSDNPLYSAKGNKTVGEDAIRAKAALEKQVFGQEYPDDNIHIQLIYNILDLRKILSVCANNIVFSLNNLRRLDEQLRENDFIGYLYTANSYERIKAIYDRYNATHERLPASEWKKCQSYKSFREYLEAITPYTGYFTDAFYAQRNGSDITKRSDKDIYSLLRLMSIVRQSTMHDNNSTRTLLYSFDDDELFGRLSTGENGYNEIRELLDKIYKEKIDRVNTDFIKNQRNNIQILFNTYGIAEEHKGDLVRRFYMFKIYNQDKNLGFSVKKLREKLLEGRRFQFIKLKKFDSARSKVYSLIDFIIYSYYTDHFDLREQFIEELRCLLTDEEKEDAYLRQSQKAYHAVGDIIINKLMPQLEGNALNKLHGAKLDDSDLTDNLRLTDKAHYFTKIIFAVCLFLDGKEINELSSALINKLSNIQSIIDVMKEQGIPYAFTDGYRMFEHSGAISDEMRTLSSIARMQKAIAGVGDISVIGDDSKKHGVSRAIMLDAVSVLGASDAEMALADMIFVDGETNLRNFITNNVLKSRRFLYTVRYMNPKRAKKLVCNTALVQLVLSGIPETQIQRYYDSCIMEKVFNVDSDTMIGALCNMITDMDIDNISDVKQKVSFKKDKDEALKKERYKACVSLYLTVLYLICKTLVKINARYTIAIGCLERDTQLHSVDNRRDDFYAMTRDVFLGNKWISSAKGEGRNMTACFEHYAFWTAKTYRNQIAHLAVLSNAYKYVENLSKAESLFQVYHSILQFSFAQQIAHDRSMYNGGNLNPRLDANPYDVFQVSPRVQYLIDETLKHGSYSRELLRILNLPFGYNIARYKNLTYELLFYQQDT